MPSDVDLRLNVKDMNKVLKTDFSSKTLNEMFWKRKTRGPKQINVVKKIKELLKGGIN